MKSCGTSVKAGRKDPNFKPVVFLVGDSDIDTGTWSSFVTYLVKKLRSLDHIVILRWEHNTSTNCPKESCGHSRLEYAGVGIRVKYCRTCNIYFHREVVAPENNVFLFRDELKNGVRHIEYVTLKQKEERLGNELLI